jgi:hypothetical protein
MRPVESYDDTTRHYFVRTKTRKDKSSALGVVFFDTASPDRLALHAFDVPIAQINHAVDAPMPNSTVSLWLTNMGTQVLNAVLRDHHLFAVFQTCKVWKAKSPCTASVRFVEVDLDHPEKPLVDTDYGGHGPGDKPGDPMVGYGWPGVMASAGGNAVVMVMRSSSVVYPELRFGVHHKGKKTIDGSQVIQHGTVAPKPSSSATDPTKPISNMDTAGMALDPKDPHKVWMAGMVFTTVNKRVLPQMIISNVTVP